LSAKEILEAAEKHLRWEFEEIKRNNSHPAESGAEAEIILGKFLKDHLPRRFHTESGFVIGPGGILSKQTDLIVFDKLESPIYGRGPRVHIVPRDNVAAVIEVKSKLNKDELADAAVKIGSVKRIRPSPITNVDQPVTFAPTIMTNTLGCVFAFDSYTGLHTLAENLREINSTQESGAWIDLVVILDKGLYPLSASTSVWGRHPGLVRRRGGGRIPDTSVLCASCSLRLGRIHAQSLPGKTDGAPDVLQEALDTGLPRSTRH
jgi:hypothetical protein